MVPKTTLQVPCRPAPAIAIDPAGIRAVLTAMHLPVVDYVDPDNQAAEALAQATDRGLISELLRELAKRGLLREEALQLPEIGRLSSPLGTLHAMTNSTDLPRDVLREFQRGLESCDLVCRIDIDGLATGTGVLVAPTLVATACHVIEPVLTVADGIVRAQKNSGRRLTVTFKDVNEDQADGTHVRGPGEVAGLAPEWLAWASPGAPGEKDFSGLVLDSVDGIDSQHGPWDVALIRLAKKRTLPGWFALGQQIPYKPFLVRVFQHPGGGVRGGLPMLVSQGQLERRLGEPPVRLMHSASTGNGSSGGPIVDADYMLIGFHQAGRPASFGHPGMNRAIPVGPLVERIGQLFRPLEGRPHPLEVLDPDGPATADGRVPTRVVIGRRTAQERLWAGGVPYAREEDRLLVVTGAPGLGLRFTKRIVQAMATQLGGLAASVDVGNCLNEDAATFAATLVGAFAEAQPQPPETGLTTAIRDLHSQTGYAVTQRLNDLADDRGIWLVLEGFQHLTVAVPVAIGEVVRDIIGQLAQAPQVRLVLVGWQDTLPAGFESSREALVAPTVSDVAALFLPPNASKQALDQVALMIQQMVDLHPTSASSRPYTALANAYAKVAPGMAVVMASASASAADGGGHG